MKRSGAGRRLGLVLGVAVSATALPWAGALAASEGEHGGGGLPQLNIETFPSQLFWLAISFAILYYVMAKIALPRIGDVLSERQRQIDDHLDRAKELSEEAEKVRAEYEESLGEARKAAQQAMADAREAIAEESARRESVFADKVSAKTKESEARIAAIQQEAQATAREVAVEAVQQIADRVAGVSVDAGAAESAVTTSLQSR